MATKARAVPLLQVSHMGVGAPELDSSSTAFLGHWHGAAGTQTGTHMEGWCHIGLAYSMAPAQWAQISNHIEWINKILILLC